MIKKCILSIIEKLALNTAIKTVNTVSKYDMYQPEIPQSLYKYKKEL